MHYSVSWSGGKDSTASIILAHEHGEPIDSIVFSEVMFDKDIQISGEDPQHVDFVWNIAKPMFEKWGYKVYILRGDKDYLDVFNRVIEKPRKHEDHRGKKYGFVISGLCSVKRDCKMKPIQNFYKNIAEEVCQYVGIALDEPVRLSSMHKNKNNISLLEKYGYTEAMARDLCEKYGLLSPTYERTNRGGCWMCPNAKVCEHREIRKHAPEAWYRFLSLESEADIAHYAWNIYTHESLMSRELFFQQEDMAEKIALSFKQVND